MANSNLPRSWEEFYVGFAQIPSEHGGRRIYRIKSILKHCGPEGLGPGGARARGARARGG